MIGQIKKWLSSDPREERRQSGEKVNMMRNQLSGEIEALRRAMTEATSKESQNSATD